METETLLVFAVFFFLNLYSYKRNTLTRTEIATSLCGDLIIFVLECDYSLLSLALTSRFGNWNTCRSFYKRRKLTEISYNIYFKTNNASIIRLHIWPKYDAIVTNILQ